MTRDNKPSYWLETHFDESVYDKLDTMYFDGELDQMDAGDVVSLAINLQKEVDDANDAEAFITKPQGKPSRKVQAATRLMRWIAKKLQTSLEDGDMEAVDNYAQALHLNARYTAMLLGNAL